MLTLSKANISTSKVKYVKVIPVTVFPQKNSIYKHHNFCCYEFVSFPLKNKKSFNAVDFKLSLDSFTLATTVL